MRIATASALLVAVLRVPRAPRGVAIVAHGAGEATYRPVEEEAANALFDAGFAVVAVDLLTRMEAVEDAESSVFRFDVTLLAERLRSVAIWCRIHPALRGPGVGVIASGTVAAAALVAAAEPPVRIDAVVSIAGRPELAGPSLTRLRAPALFLVGAHDSANLAVTRASLDLMSRSTQLQVIADARHLLDAPEERTVAAALASAWLGRHLAARAEHSAMRRAAAR